MGGRLLGKQLRIYRATFFPAPQNRHGVKIFTVPCVNLFSVSDIYFQTRIADKDLLFLRWLLGTRQAYKWGVVHLTGVQPVKGAQALDLLATWQHIWADFCSPATHLGQILATWRHIWGQILLIGWLYLCQAAAARTGLWKVGQFDCWDKTSLLAIISAQKLVALTSHTKSVSISD